MIKTTKKTFNETSGAANGMLGMLSEFGMRDLVTTASRGDGKLSDGKWEHMEVNIQ